MPAEAAMHTPCCSIPHLLASGSAPSRWHRLIQELPQDTISTPGVQALESPIPVGSSQAHRWQLWSEKLLFPNAWCQEWLHPWGKIHSEVGECGFPSRGGGPPGQQCFLCYTGAAMTSSSLDSGPSVCFLPGWGRQGWWLGLGRATWGGHGKAVGLCLGAQSFDKHLVCHRPVPGTKKWQR